MTLICSDPYLKGITVAQLRAMLNELDDSDIITNNPVSNLAVYRGVALPDGCNEIDRDAWGEAAYGFIDFANGKFEGYD